MRERGTKETDEDTDHLHAVHRDVAFHFEEHLLEGEDADARGSQDGDDDASDDGGDDCDDRERAKACHPDSSSASAASADDLNAEAFKRLQKAWAHVETHLRRAEKGRASRGVG